MNECEWSERERTAQSDDTVGFLISGPMLSLLLVDGDNFFHPTAIKRMVKTIPCENNCTHTDA